MRNAFAITLSLATAFVVSACGDSSTAPTAPPPPPLPTVESLIASADQTSIVEGTSTQVHAMAHYTDGTSKDVTRLVTWTPSAPLVSVSSSGMLTGLQPGSLEIQASYGGKVGTVAITVTPAGTPWSQLLPISETAKVAVLTYNIRPYGAVTHWTDTMRIFAPEASLEDKVGMVTFWESYLGEDMTPYRFVSNESEANFKIRQIWPISGVDPKYCGWATIGIVNHVIVSAQVNYDKRPSCVTASGSSLLVLKHEWGHANGWNGHNADGVDIMSAPPLMELELPPILLRE